MDGIDSMALGLGLAGGLAMFLFGMDIMTGALKRVTGDRLKTLLLRMTRNRFAGMTTGAVLTAIVQSSSVTTVLLVGFISAGMMKMPQSVAVILGANVGTTITAQVLAFKVTALALPLVSLGFFATLLARREDVREYGTIALGLGVVFLGMTIMGEAMHPLRDYRPFVDFMLSLESPLLAAAVGAGFTAVIQSSSATTGLLIVLAGQGLITLEPAIALALGANIGTCVTAMLAAIGKPRAAVQAAVVHTLVNVGGVLVWILLVDQLAEVARMMSPVHPDLPAEARPQAEIPRQIANVHTVFNLVNAAVLVWLTGPIARLVERLVPDRAVPLPPESVPRHLDPQLLDVPVIALDAARLEIVRLGRMVQAMMDTAMPALVSGSPLELSQLRVMDRPIDLLHRQILDYLRRISLGDLSGSQSELFMALAKIANDLEHVGDQIATGMVTSARKRIDENVMVSATTAAKIGRLHGRVLTALTHAIDALERSDRGLAAEVRAMKTEVFALMDEVSRHQIARLRADEAQRLPAYAREIELSEALEDIFKTVRRIARLQLAFDDHQQPAMPPDPQSGTDKAEVAILEPSARGDTAP